MADDRRKVLTSHDAFGYFGREYNVSFLAPLGLSTESEASAADVAKLIEQIKTRVKAYFIENLTIRACQADHVNRSRARRRALCRVAVEGQRPGCDYEKMFRYNVDQLAAAMEKSS